MPNNKLVSQDVPAYQTYEWCYHKYIEERLNYKEIAEEAGCKPRTIQKWCSERYGLNRKTIANLIHLNKRQKELIIFSLLGDGHISKRDCCFIVSHAENQNDYCFWKYSILKNLCHSPPVFREGGVIRTKEGKTYKQQNYYRLTTRKLNDLVKIVEMDKSEIISQLNEFGLSIHFLDDGSCSNNIWSLCYASLSDNQKELYCKILQDRFNIYPHMYKDKRYIGFSKADSKIISQIILSQLPNNLDIIKYKILKEDNYA